MTALTYSLWVPGPPQLNEPCSVTPAKNHCGGARDIEPGSYGCLAAPDLTLGTSRRSLRSQECRTAEGQE